MGKVLNFKKWSSSIDESNKYNANSFEDWKILEQNATGGSPTIEEAIFSDLLEDLNGGKVKNTNIAMQVYNSLSMDQVTAMVESIKNYSNKVFKNWDKLHEQYRFIISKYPGGAPTKHDLNVIAVNDNYEVAITTDGKTFSGWKNMDDIINEVNAYNASVGFESTPKSITRDANVRIPDESRPKGYRLGYAIMIRTSSTSDNSNHIKQYALLDVRENTKEEVTDPGSPDKVVTKPLTAKATGSNGFAVGKYELQNDDIVTKLVDSIEAKLKDAGEKQFKKIKVVSSASNFWGTGVPYTHEKDGTAVDTETDFKSEPFPGKSIDDLNKGESKNKKLAYLRGSTIADKVKELAIERGITTSDAKVTIEWRVTNTGGKNDAKDAAPEDKGQYFKVVVGGFGVEKTVIKGDAPVTEDKLTSLNFDIGSFGIALKNLNAPSPKKRGFLGIGGPKAIILKKGGKFYKGGSRGKGGNRNQFSFQGKRRGNRL